MRGRMALPPVSPFTPEQGICWQDALRLPLRARCQSPKSSSPPCSWPASSGSGSAPCAALTGGPHADLHRRGSPPSTPATPLTRTRSPAPTGTRTRLARTVQALRQGHLCHPPHPRSTRSPTYRAERDGLRMLAQLRDARSGLPALGRNAARIHPLLSPLPGRWRASPPRACDNRPSRSGHRRGRRPVEFRAVERRHDERRHPG